MAHAVALVAVMILVDCGRRNHRIHRHNTNPPHTASFLRLAARSVFGRAESRPVNDDIDLQEAPFAMPQAEQCL